MRRPTETLEADFARYGDLYSVNNPMYGREVVASHPELIKEILTGDPAIFRGGEANESLGVVMGRSSVLVLDGAPHHRERKLLMPPFHGERLGVYAKVMARVTREVAADIPRGTPLSILPYLQRITFDVVLETVFGARQGAELETLRRRLADLVERIQSPLGMLWLLPALQRDLGPLTGWRSIQRSIAAADEAIHALIARARAETGRGDDVLSMLLAARDDDGAPMSDEELRDELITLLLAGHETTASTLAWTVDEVARRPDALERVRAEPAAAAGGASPYLVPCPYNAQRHPAYWDAPAAFRPERFLGAKIDPYAWLPFGGGARRCIGMAFALFEAKVILATLLEELEIELVSPPAKVKLRSFLFAPAGGPRVVVQARAAAARRVSPAS